MSSLDVMNLATQCAEKQECFGPNLVACLVNLITDLIRVCYSANLDLSSQEAFNPQNH